MASKTILLTFVTLYICSSNAAKVWKNQALNKEVLKRYSNVHLAPQCAKKCVLSRKCKTFAFLKEEADCYLYDEKPNGNNLVNKTGSKLYTLDDFDLIENLHGACSSNPCKNGATCFEVASEVGYVCDCTLGWGGQNCHTDVGTFGWDLWGDWTKCSVSCSVGWQQRRRKCVNSKTGKVHSVQHCFGSPVDYVACNLKPCPVWQQWGEWEECTTRRTCGAGQKTRRRACEHGGTVGKDRGCLGPTSETAPCEYPSCDVPIKLTENGSYGQGKVEVYNYNKSQWDPICPDKWDKKDGSVLCRYLGFRKGAHRAYTTDTTKKSYLLGGFECKGSESSLVECSHFGWGRADNCSAQGHGAAVQCIVDGHWQDWQSWGECSVSCAKGIRYRQRKCNSPEAANGGIPCEGPDQEEESCEGPPCPVDGVWVTWSAWSPCSVDCGGGIQWRNRSCDGPRYGGRPCPGSTDSNRTCNTHHCPVDGAWYPWGSWSGCDRSCNKGARTRTRNCQVGMHGGKNCTGTSNEKESCNDFACPVDGVWIEWTSWDTCTHTCGGGTQKRNRTCEGPFHGGKECEGPSTESQICNTQSCAVDGKWKEWQAWGKCSKSCGPGAKIRKRDCELPKHGGKMCDGPSEEKMHCEEKPCPVDGVWLSWSKFGDCSVTCGGGVQWRSRVCKEPKHEGKPCAGPSKDQQNCSTNACPVDGYWEEWNDWSKCSQTCGSEGKMTRSRICHEPKHGGKPCPGVPVQEEACNEFPCPVDGRWSPWSRWLPCSASCGGGTQKRTRACGGTSNGGKDCEGESEEIQACNEQKCPIDGKLDSWQTWSECDVSCGGGKRNRNRVCIGPFHGGEDCKEALSETEDCNTHECPVHGIWKEWSLWDSCTLSCGNGTQTRNRECIGPFHGGKPCEGPTDDTQTCFLKHCPVDGKWDKWSDWDVCSISCGGGKQSRQRECIGPFHGGEQCIGGTSETQSCNENPCPVDGFMGEWQSWTKCSASCQGGVRSRKRVCDEPLHGGKPCLGETEQSEDCNTHECPLPGDWMEWEAWNGCSKTCGGGTRLRHRKCNMETHGDLTAPCLGQNRTSENCNTFKCDPIEPSCSAWVRQGLVNSDYVQIEPDYPPFWVYCNMTQDKRGVSIIHHNREARSKVEGYEGAGEYLAALTYITEGGSDDPEDITYEQLIALADQSESCRQFIKWECKEALMTTYTEGVTKMTYWENRWGDKMNYWGDADQDSGVCGCNTTNTCRGHACNCDHNDAVWREDSGYLMFKDDLPLTNFKAGDTGKIGDEEEGFHTIGPMECVG